MVQLPLQGIRVIDFCVAWAGPYATMLLGDLGAEVIKVENPHVWAPVSRGGRARPTAESVAALGGMYGGYPNGDPGPRPWNYSPTFVQPFRNKKSFTADLRTPVGKDILGRLVSKSDIFVENNSADYMERLGITPEWLRSIRPDIIIVSLPAFGLSGPYADARALGVHLEAVMGHSLLRGYRDMEPSSNTNIFAGDYFGGLIGALGAMMAIWHRRRAGTGQVVEIAQAEAASAMFAQAFMEYSINRGLHTRAGNRSVYAVAPSGVYPCRSSGSASNGDDRWIAISVTSDDEWEALVDLMGQPRWAMAPQLAAVEGRIEQQDELDVSLAEWTAQQDDYELMYLLQARRIPSAPVLEASRALDDPHVRQRQIFQPQTMFDGVGTFRFLRPFFRFPETPSIVHQPPVAMGEHNDYVYRELLELSDEEVQDLREAGHITMDFDPDIL
ncbi:MAG TPA: CoA transferase [Dehalococcoidia bacterium]|nr:CoA transferase [Dehalococcoidia bacterium]